MKRTSVLGILVAAALVSVALATGRAQEERNVTIQSLDVRENLYVISGGGGHTAALVTEQPITTIINTHTHGDHVGGNTDFPATVEVVAHANAASRMAEMDAFAGANASALPDRTYTDRVTLLEGRDQIDLYHFGAGHTDGDTVVVFPALGTIHMGDLFAFRGPPYIDVDNGGSGVAYPDTLDAVLAEFDDIRRVIPGHIPPPTGSPMRGWTVREDLEEYARFNREFLDAVRASREAGRSVEEAVAALDLWSRYPEYSQDRVEANVQAIYEELSRR